MKYVYAAAALLLLAGISGAGYLSYAHLSGAPAVCYVVSGCDTVLASPYSRVFGVPVSYIGLGYYLAAVCLLLLSARGKIPLLGLFLYASAGILVSVILVYIQAFVLRSFCSSCLVSAFCSLGFFICSFLLWRKGNVPAAAEE